MSTWVPINYPDRLTNSLGAPLSLDWIKINMDGALLQTHSVGLGAISRDDKGDFIKQVGKQLLHRDTTLVEIEASLYIIELIVLWMIEKKGVIAEGDNEAIISHFQQSLMETWYNKPQEGLDISFLSHFHQFLFKFVPRNTIR